MPLAERTPPESTSTPLNPTERIDVIEVLRDVALFGVMAINEARTGKSRILNGHILLTPTGSDST
jgi:uncharacterized membrane protein YeiB